MTAKATGLAIACAMTAAPGAAHAACAQIPATFSEGRVLVRYPTGTHGTLTLFTDTGGAGSMIATATAERLGLTSSPLPEAGELGATARLVPSPPASALAAVPSMPAPAIALPSVMPVKDWPEQLDGMLGQSWFAGHTWTWDYPAGRLYSGCRGTGRSVPIGLKSESGARQFPRIGVEVGGETIDMLLDTGATTWLTEVASRELGNAPRVGATSMTTASRIARWRREHPDWRMIEAAQRGTGARMIEVPDVRIAGLDVGPVWFTERPDASFTRMMSSMTDRPVEGAIGGNAFRSLRMTIDYPGRRAWFERSRKARTRDRSKPAGN